MISLIDTNVIVRFLTASKEKKYHGLYAFFSAAERGQIRTELKLIVLFQVIFVLKSVYKVPEKDIAESLLALLEYKGISVSRKKLVRRTLEVWRDNFGLDVVDAYLIANLERYPENVLYSYDRGFDRFGIRRKEPGNLGTSIKI